MNYLPLRFTFLLISTLFFVEQGVAQGVPDFEVACRQAQPFCSDASEELTFPNTIGEMDGHGEVGCLNTTPNPSWYFLRIAESGNLVFDIKQWVDEDGDNRLDRNERELDVDFIAWGPFPTSFINCDILARGCNLNNDENTNPAECENNADAPDFYTSDLDNTNIIDCSYARNPDDTFIETFTIPDAIEGEYYIVLITNFADEQGVIQLEQTNLGEEDAGTTDCSVLDDGVGPDIATCGVFPVTVQGRFAGAIRYQWYQDTGGGNFTPIGGAEEPFLEVNQTGTYRLEGFDGNGNSLGTDDIQVLDVTVSLVSVDFEIREESFAGNYTVTAIPQPTQEVLDRGYSDFEYRLDRDLNNGEGFFEYRPFQSSPIFENVPPGDYQIVARYRDCEISEVVSEIIMILGYPKYFTPNGDNNHDTWALINIEDQPTALIYIFDRYGKLLKQLRPGGPGWDGTYNGQLMPSSEYWFRVEFNEPRDPNMRRRTFAGSFSLIR